MDVSSFTRCRILDGNMSSLTLRGGRVDAPTFHLDRRNAHAVCFGTECWNTFCLHSAAQKTMNLFFRKYFYIFFGVAAAYTQQRRHRRPTERRRPIRCILP